MGVDHPVIAEHPRQHQRHRLGFDLTLNCNPHSKASSIIHVLTEDLCGRTGEDPQQAGQLGATLHRRVGVGSGEKNNRELYGASIHAVVFGSVRRTDQQRDMRNNRVGHGVDHHRAVLDHAALFIVFAHHVSAIVVQEQQ